MPFSFPLLTMLGTNYCVRPASNRTLNQISVNIFIKLNRYGVLYSINVGLKRVNESDVVAPQASDLGDRTGSEGSESFSMKSRQSKVATKWLMHSDKKRACKLTHDIAEHECKCIAG